MTKKKDLEALLQGGKINIKFNKYIFLKIINIIRYLEKYIFYYCLIKLNLKY